MTETSVSVKSRDVPLSAAAARRRTYPITVLGKEGSPAHKVDATTNDISHAILGPKWFANVAADEQVAVIAVIAPRL